MMSSVFLIYVVGFSEALLGLVTNVFITASNLLDWMEGRKLKPFDKIFLSLGLSRSLHICLFIFNITARALKLKVYSFNTLNWILNMAYLFLDFSSLWFAMWLCVLYFIKITIFKKAFLIHIKLIIPHLVLYMIVSSILIPLISSFVFVYNYNEPFDLMIPEVAIPINSSIEKELMFIIPAYCLGHFLPFVMVSISTLFLIHTIVGHVKRIKSNVTSFTTPRMDAHLSAIRSISLVELMTISYLIVTILLRFNFFETFDQAIVFVLVLAYPTFHSIVLITGNAKLKKRLLIVVHYVKRCEPKPKM